MIENPNVICNDCGYCKQNKQLKELLKECEHINICLQNALWQWNEESELYEECDKIEAKINQALGEDK